nr:HAD-IA family hydrolase [Paenibacillus sp. 1_12]
MDNTLLQSRIDFGAMKTDIFNYLHTSGIVPVDLPLSTHTCATLIEYGKQTGLANEQEKKVWEIAAKHELLGMESAGLESGVESLLKRLHQNYTLAVVTNNSIHAALEALHETKIHEYFDLIVGREQMTALKPSHSGFHYVLNQFPQISPDEWLSVGDSWIDGKASTESGIRFICYQTDLEIMRERGVPVLARIEHMMDLHSYL